MREIMRRASRVVLGAHELRTDYKIIRHPDRYTDRRGDAVWANVLALLTNYERQQIDGRENEGDNSLTPDGVDAHSELQSTIGRQPGAWRR
jgi:hypothetical protein